MKQRVNRRRFLTLAAVALISVIAVLIVGFRQAEGDYFFKINKSIDIFGRVYREVALNYVDEVDPENFMESGIDGMLATLDPYTTYISEKEADEVELITTGKYGGIGVTIGVRDGRITVMTVLDGYSAQRQGLQPGDQILAIDGKPIVDLRPESVRSLTRGDPGTEIHLSIKRDEEANLLELTLIREEIQLKNISYADFIADGVAYIHIERFARSAGDELRLALRELKLRGTIKGVILDLRDNPGGLLDVAVDVVEKFVPKGSLVVSTRGRKPESEKKFFAAEDPLLPDVPLVVLVNHNSASASEIVAGAIQDLDRGVILGTRTFGKGLVQTITPLVYNTQLKITTAKYYTPSGRCIQEIDYSHKNADGRSTAVPESLRQEFKTSKGRSEFERGGIQPDTIVTDAGHSVLHTELTRKSMYVRFASFYAGSHPLEVTQSLNNDSLFLRFKEFLAKQHFTFKAESQSKLDELLAAADKEHFGPAVHQEIAALKENFEKEKAELPGRHREEILEALRMELMSRVRGESGRVQESLARDPQVNAAEELLLHRGDYVRRLTLGTDRH